jgi:hypothetical protein
MRDMKGQMSIQGIIFGFISLLMFSAFVGGFYSLINSVNGNATAVNDGITPTIMNLVVPMFAIGILLIPVLYTLGGRGRGEEG